MDITKTIFTILLCCFIVSAGEKCGARSVAIKCLDGRTRALGIFVPKKYKSKVPSPLFFWLHGGVNKPAKDRGVEAALFFKDQAEIAGILCAAPSGEAGATWFDEVGYNNILMSFSYMLNHFNVDTNMIFVGGSSDGASACYLMAMKEIEPKIRGFVACSGFPGILRNFGEKFVPELCKNHKWYVIHTGKDHLYPISKVKNAVYLIRKSGADVIFRDYPELPHGLEYFQKEQPLILKWMLNKK